MIETQDIKLLYNPNDLTSGKLIFGSSPKFTIPMHIEEITIFCFRFDQITYEGEDYTTDIGLDFNSAGIVAPGSFYKRIDKFFSPFMKNNTCKYINLPNSYVSTIFCDDSFDSMEQFGKIYFNVNDFGFKHSFTLEGKELFMKVKNGYLFLIRSYLMYISEKWVLGLPFFGKYPVTFNLEKNLLGFDIKINKDNNKGDKSNNDLYISWILLGILGLLFILIIGFNVYYFVFKKKRTIRANELDEDIVYSAKKDEDNKLGI